MHEFLSGGGEMGELIRRHDWATTPLGPIDAWPRSLRTCVQIMLTSRQPIWLGWGKELIKLYNDPYRQIVQGKHPWALGKPASIVWNDIWRDIDPMLQKVMLHNEGTYVEEQLLIMERNGYPEETYYTFSYTPVAGDDGNTSGMICFNTDDTERIISERQLKTLTQLGKALNDLKSADQAFAETIRVLRDNPHDFPFALLYKAESHFISCADATERNTLFEKKYGCVTPDPEEELARLFSACLEAGKPQLLERLREKIGDMPKGAWEVSPDQAIILPIAQRANKDAYGYLIVGVNPFRPLDEKYLGFFQLVADQIATSFANIQAIEEERKRLEALAEIDRAKTAFFSNISHEFRTPLTLMLGSTEELLRKQNEIGDNVHIVETTHRNALRLLRLVNNLLDFSRIEAGREKATFHKVDIVKFTRELASNFTSLIDQSGLQYELAMSDVRDEVYVDRVMWEKIVLNLISNAFKYTLKGKITVSLRQEGEHVVLRVKDTGVGIPKEELPKMFHRFHRVQNTTGRTYEGTGIGLSLVSELIKLHSGSIAVTSDVGVGSEFKVEIPVGRAHITEAELGKGAGDELTSLSSVFIEEGYTLVSNPPEETIASGENPAINGTLLVVDDNADMRGYIKQLLQKHFNVLTAVNGEDALQKIKMSNPELVVSDIMMPVMDGIQLMKAIKNDPATKALPVILLSARAGEEAKIEGYEIGADDYLVKPFSANELIARITSQFKLAKVRKEVESSLRNLILQSPVGMALLRGPALTVEIVNATALEIWGKSHSDVINKPLALAMPEITEQGFIDLLKHVYDTGEVFKGNEVPIQLIRFGERQTLYINFIYSPLRDDHGNIIGLVGVGIDVTEQVSARKVIEETKAALNNAVEVAELGTWSIDLSTSFTSYSPRVAEWWGLPERGVSLNEVIECIHPDDRGTVNAAVDNAVARTGHYEAEYRLINALTGQERYIEANGNVSYDDKKKPVKLMGIVRDITLQKLAQKELERQVQARTLELQLLNEDLKRSNNELMQFAYVASHDLQEPLRKIQTFSDLARSDGSTEQVKIFLNKIDNSAARMSTLIKDVLLYSKVSKEGKGNSEVDLDRVLEDVKNDFELLILQKNARILAGSLPTVSGNKLHYHQLFSNLIGNSLKFTLPGNDPLIQIAHQIVPGYTLPDQKVDAGKSYHELTFTDNGIGFEQSYAHQIFGLFTRLHNKKDYSGTGIGLALCKKIVENQNGFIHAFSSKNKGATFKVFLPVHSGE